MRSHTVAAEGGAAGVKRDDDSFDYHFHDTVGGGDWLCEQDVVEYFVKQAPVELTDRIPLAATDGDKRSRKSWARVSADAELPVGTRPAWTPSCAAASTSWSP